MKCWILGAAVLVVGAGNAWGAVQYTVTDVLGVWFGEPFGINGSGQVVGFYQPSSYHAFLYSNGELADLGTLPGNVESGATGINATGQVVGWSTNSKGNQHAVLYSNGTMTDLNTLIPSGWTLTYAEGINDSGKIVGCGNYNGSGTRAFLLTPEFLPGDANMDWTVNVADLTLLLSNYNKTGMVWANGDFTSDGTVNVADLTLLLNNYNRTAEADVVAGAAVPEPNSAILAGIALTASLYWWRKR